jgi:predicted secreted protein
MTQLHKAHSIKVTQHEGLGRWKVTWETLAGSQAQWFDEFALVSHFIEVELLS